MSKSTPKHPAVSPWVLRDTIQCTLVQRGHHPADLALATIATFSGPALQLSGTQSQALELLKDKLTQWQSVCSIKAAGLPPADYMQSLMPLISDIFFLGKLTRVTFKWKWNLQVNGGSAVGAAFTNANNCSDVVLDKKNWLRYENIAKEGHSDRCRWILGTLLHECAHAYFDQYTCASLFAEHCEETACTAPMGSSWHGSPWIQLCSHIEAAVKLWLGDVNLGVEERLGRDFREGGQIMDEEEIKSCHQSFQASIRRRYQTLLNKA